MLTLNAWSVKQNNDDIVGTDDDEHHAFECRTSNEFLNRFNGCSLDSISTYLQLVEAEQNKSFKRRRGIAKNFRESVVVMAEEEEVKEEVEKSEKEWNKSKNARGREWKKLTEAEKKLCNILKTPAVEYKRIEAQIAKRVYQHGLVEKGKIPQQLFVDIDEDYNVEMRIGIVDPQRFAI